MDLDHSNTFPHVINISPCAEVYKLSRNRRGMHICPMSPIKTTQGTMLSLWQLLSCGSRHAGVHYTSNEHLQNTKEGHPEAMEIGHAHRICVAPDLHDLAAAIALKYAAQRTFFAFFSLRVYQLERNA